VVIIEDLDILAAGKTREEIAQLLDLMDSVGNKNQEVMVIFTTNFLGDIDRGALRPGRIDSVIRIAHLDEGGYTRLVKSVIPAARLAAEINYAQVAEAFKDFLPAFASETARKALLYSMSRTGTGEELVTTDDLLAAAALMRDQKELMDRAHEATRNAPTLDETLVATVARVLRSTRISQEYDPFVVDENVK
jgi:ATP-dependent 26S proteasome regulatory subunit